MFSHTNIKNFSRQNPKNTVRRCRWSKNKHCFIGELAGFILKTFCKFGNSQDAENEEEGGRKTKTVRGVVKVEREVPEQILSKIWLRNIKTDQQHQTKIGVSNWNKPELILNIVRQVDPDPRVHGLWVWWLSTKTNIALYEDMVSSFVSLPTNNKPVEALSPKPQASKAHNSCNKCLSSFPTQSCSLFWKNFPKALSWCLTRH